MRKVLVLALALAVLFGAQFLNWRQHSNVSVSVESIAGNPVSRYRTAAEPAGVVIVAHGFASNKQMMSGWGYYLANQGLDVYLLDEPGHGASQRPLPDWRGPAKSALGDNLRAIIDELIRSGQAKPGRIALIGHSMGGFAVTTAALQDARVATTVAISSAYREPLPPGLPANFLGLAAERDPSYMVEAVQNLVPTQDGKPALGVLYGDFQNGSAREADVVPGRNHITIIYDTAIMHRAAEWIGHSFGTSVRPVQLSWTWVLVALAAALGVVLTVGAIVAPPVRQESRRPMGAGLLTGLGTLAVAAFSAVLAVVYIRFNWIGLSVVDYLLPYFVVMGVVLLVLRLLWPREFGFPVSGGLDEALTSLLRTLALFLGYVGAVGTVLHQDISYYLPAGGRILPLILITIGLFFYFVQEEALKRAVSFELGAWGGFVVGLIGKALIIGTWMGASALPNPQPFLSLITPVVLVFMLVMEVFSLILSRWRYSTVGIALFTSLALAWTIASTFPLV